IAAVLLVVLSWSSLSFGGEIHDAAAAGDLAKVKTLLGKNPSLVNSKDDVGNTALIVAAKAIRANSNPKGTYQVVEFLLTNKADVNAKGNDGLTPLLSAASTDHTDIAKLLLDNKADVSARDDGSNTPLHWAAGNGYLDMAKLLLAVKAEVDAKNNFGDTPLAMAASADRIDMVKFLLANKADVNTKNSLGWTPLFSLDRVDMVKILFGHKKRVKR